MGRTTLSPENWGKHATDWGDQFFRIRVAQEQQPERLRAALRYEGARSDPRKERISALNTRLIEITD